MIELQVINHILTKQSLNFLHQNGITPDHFVSYKDEMKYIIRHHDKYGIVPDKETFVSKFKDFDFLTVRESPKYLVETLKEEHLYSKMVPFVHKIADLVQVDANEAVEYAKTQLAIMEKISEKYKAGYDIVKEAPERKVEFERRLKIEGLLGVETGIDEINNITHGWLPEDLIVIVGRTNEGKTWLLLFFLVMAWKEGKSVLLYSGEMSKTMVGFRFDTLNENFNHNALTSGTEKLGKDDNPKTADDYYEYLTNLSKTEVPFIVVTPKDLGGKRLTIPMLHGLIEQYNPDIIGIDQLSLMDDYRAKKGDQERLKYTHIAEDLYLTSEKYQKPILSPSQASRDAEKDTKQNQEKTPELHQIAESDGVGQNATRVITMKQSGMTMKITVKKNRYGPKNQEILLIWDIENGIVKPFLRVSTNDKGKPIETKKIEDKKKPTLSGEELF